jgi:hypothetical protein
MISKLFAILACAILLQTFSAFAQNTPSNSLGVPGCGDPKTKFDVEISKSQAPARPDTTKALIYFLEDDTFFNSIPKPTTRLGIDGEWTGATHGNSYFFVPIEPGVHHLCVSWQSSLPALGQGNQSAAAHFTAEPGGIYYFEVKNKLVPKAGSEGPGIVEISLELLDSDQGQLQVNKFKLSTSHPKN